MSAEIENGIENHDRETEPKVTPTHVYTKLPKYRRHCILKGLAIDSSAERMRVIDRAHNFASSISKIFFALAPGL